MQIGQYALYSIQRKQNSATEKKTGEVGGIRKRKPATRKKAAASAQQKHVPPPPPTPANKDRQTPEQEWPTPASMPLQQLQQQGYPSSSDWNRQLGVSTLMTLDCSYGFPQYSDMMAAQFVDPQLASCEQPPNNQILAGSHQSLSSGIDVDDPYQVDQDYSSFFGVPNDQQHVYTEHYLRQHGDNDAFSGSTTQNSGNWELDQGQPPLYQQMAIGGVQQEQHANSQDFQSYVDLQQGHANSQDFQHYVDLPQGHANSQVFQHYVDLLQGHANLHDQLIASSEGDNAVASKSGDDIGSPYAAAGSINELDLAFFK
jgi:hypothetical protein